MNIAMIGAGQQGTSQGLAYARLASVGQVVFYDKTLERDVILTKAQDAGIDLSKLHFADTIADAVGSADVIGLNVPMSEFESVSREIAAHAKSDAILYDNGSGKVQAEQDVRAGLAGSSVRYVPLHILEGRAGSGAGTADADMYKGVTAAVITPDADAQSVQIISDLLKDIGLGTVRTDLTAARHDEALGRFSHHNTFYQMTLMRAFPDSVIGEKTVTIEPFLSSTRVAKSGTLQQDGSAMWAPIAKDNKNAILAAGLSVQDNLVVMADAIRSGRFGDLADVLGKARDYVAQIKEVDAHKNPRIIEDINGALHDLNEQGADDPDAYIGSHVVAPVLFAAAAALGADAYERQGGEPYRSINNPSFRDTVRPANVSPDKVAALVAQNVGIVDTAMTKLIETHAGLLSAIEQDNETTIRTHIREANEERHRLPAHSTNGRPQFSL